MATVTGDADLVRVGAGKLYVGVFGTAVLPVTIATATDDATLTTTGNWTEVGFTTEGSAVTYSQTTEGVNVAERLRPVKHIVTAVEMSFEFTMAQISVENLQIATNAPDSAIQSTVDETTFTFPKSGGTQRHSILWVADDDLEALVLAKCFAGGDITIPHRQGAEAAAVNVSFNIEENSTVQTTINSVAEYRDAYIIQDDSIAA